MRIHPMFWYELGKKVGLEKNSPPDTDTFSQWISLLLATAPAYPDEFILLWLGERCIERNSMGSLIEIFDAMVASHLVLRRGLAWPGEAMDDGRSRCFVESVGEHDTINELWEDGLKPNLD